MQQVDQILKAPPGAGVRWSRGRWIDAGPPVRVALIWAGFLDNWVGIIYDPTGEVLKSNDLKRDYSNWNDPKLAPVKELFGGDMQSAEHLWGDWYFCGFT